MLNTEGNKSGSIPGQTDLPVRVILTGFRATGKSVVGEQLASLFGYRFIDTDNELVSRVQCNIAKYVTQHGWPAFRELERELLDHLALMEQVVIATGGGAVLHKKEWKLLRKKSLVVWLQADVHTINERLRMDPVSHDQRPPLKDDIEHEEVHSILAERESSYREGSDMAIDTTDKLPEEIAAFIKDHITHAVKA